MYDPDDIFEDTSVCCMSCGNDEFVDISLGSCVPPVMQRCGCVTVYDWVMEDVKPKNSAIESLRLGAGPEARPHARRFLLDNMRMPTNLFMHNMPKDTNGHDPSYAQSMARVLREVADIDVKFVGDPLRDYAAVVKAWGGWLAVLRDRCEEGSNDRDLAVDLIARMCPVQEQLARRL